MKIAIIRLDPAFSWSRKEVNTSAVKLEALRKDADQNYVRGYWQKFAELLSAEFTRRGHEVKTKILKRWDVQPELISQLNSDLVYIPHTSAHLFPYDAPAFYYMQVMQAWLFTADPLGWSSRSSKYPALDYVEGNPNSGIFERYKKLIVEKNASKFKQSKSRSRLNLIMKKDIPAFGDYIFFPCQLPHDESIIYNSDVDELDIITKLSAWCNQNKINIIFKRHPANLKSMIPLQEAATGPYVRWSDASIHDLIRYSTAVYTINSGVGFEAFLHEKPVVTFGRAEYDAVTIKTSSDALDNAWSQVKSWDKQREVTKYKTFYDWFCRLYCVDLDDNEITQERIKTMCDEAESYVRNRSYEKAS